MENNTVNAPVSQGGKGGSFSKETPESSQVNRIAYDADDKKFTIWFKNGVYDYFDVPQRVADKCYDAPSMGVLGRTELKSFIYKKRES